MAKIKKLLIFILVTVILGGVAFGWYLILRPDKKKSKRPEAPKVSVVEIPELIKASKQTFVAGEVSQVVKGIDGEKIEVDYTHTGEEDKKLIVAYEYEFVNNTDDDYAINIDELTTGGSNIVSGANIKYAWSVHNPLDIKNSTFDAYGEAVTQTLVDKGDKLYAYIIVVSEDVDSIVDVSAMPKFYKGKPLQVDLISNIDNSTICTQTLVENQSIDYDTFLMPEVPEGYYYDNMFVNSDYTTTLNDAIAPVAKSKMYVRYHNIEFGKE
ncbi:MAG: hypothetical protein ACLRFE_01635, partial [Clostridia bacterium]